MLSFPTTVNTGGSQINLPTVPRRSIGDILKNMGQNFVTSAVNTLVGGAWGILNGAQTSNTPPNTEDIPYDVFRNPAELVQRTNIMSPDYVQPGKGTINMLSSKAAKNNWYENALVMNPQIYSLMNTYRVTFKKPIYVTTSSFGIDDDNGKQQATGMYVEYEKGSVSPSLFNPYYGVRHDGPNFATPLNDKPNNNKFDNILTDFTDCSIARLCKLSTEKESVLGQAKYKYSDFMYCKDLGMPNNRLITLRRFSMPVGDMIFGKSILNSEAAPLGDIGRLIGYFDTDENRLEDILNYSFSATWRDLESEIQQKDSKEDQRESPLGKVLNTFSSGYRKAVIAGTADANNSLFGGLFNKQFGKFSTSSWYVGNETLYNYDKNKVYEPVDTIRQMSIYEGKLQFNHEFTLTFVYTLRSYDNINPKAAMLDLLSNVTAVCYKRGNFWGGRQQIIGAQPNYAGWRQADNFINNKFDAIGGAIENLMKGGVDVSGLLGSISNKIKDAASAAASTMKSIMSGNFTLSEEAKSNVGMAIGETVDMLKTAGKNFLGKPQLYAFNSLLTGADTGLWHVTIGNPLNPIASMGNLIMTNATVQHFGPLGQDDFPTGLKVTVTLKHARPRDMMDIQKMYTQGIMAMYIPINLANDMNRGTNAAVDKRFDISSAGGKMYIGDDNQERIKRNLDELA